MDYLYGLILFAVAFLLIASAFILYGPEHLKKLWLEHKRNLKKCRYNLIVTLSCCIIILIFNMIAYYRLVPSEYSHLFMLIIVITTPILAHHSHH